MNVIFAFDSFKESINAITACAIASEAWLKALPHTNIIQVPMADGGEGTMETIIHAKKGIMKTIRVHDPLMRPISAQYGLIDNGETAVIEMAQASGLPLLKIEERNPLLTSTYGTGELIKDAIMQGVEHILLTIGGSATNDAGAGMLSALGVEFYDDYHQKIEPNGSNLINISSIDTSQSFLNKLQNISITIACDVRNPLIGEWGASKIFAPQKGANDEDVIILDHNLCHYGKLLESLSHRSLIEEEGSGAAGGLAVSLLAFTQAKIVSGVEMVSEVLSLKKFVTSADLVISGEGRIDGQTAEGKTPMGVARIAKQFDVPVILVAGILGDGYEKLYDLGVSAIFPMIAEIQHREEALLVAEQNLTRTIFNIASLYRIMYHDDNLEHG